MSPKSSPRTTTGNNNREEGGPPPTKFTVQRLVELVHELQENEHHENTPQSGFDFEHLALELVGKPLNKCANGLSPDQVDSRREEFGSNEIPLPSIPTYLDLVLDGFNDPTLKILLASAVISIALAVINGEGGIEGVSVLLTVLIVVNVTALTNYDKAKEFRKQQLEVDKDKSVWVVRGATGKEGKMEQIHPKHLVVGDVFRVQVGTVVPVDGIVLTRGADLSVDESALTGESKMIHKQYCSVLISGTSVMKGESLVVCVAVGKHSVSGRIFSLILQEQEEGGNSVLFEKLEDLAVQVGRLGMACSLLVFVNLLGSWLLFAENHGKTWGESITTILGFFISAVTVLVVAVPEGLPLAVTLALSVSLNRLLKDNNQVKSMDSCETMGSATTICSDKTGTLTENRMTVVEQSECKDMEMFTYVCAMCVSPETHMVKNAATGQWDYTGNATECALLRFCMDGLGVDPREVQAKFVDPHSPDLQWGTHANPFSSERKMMSLVIKLEDGSHVLLVKGAPQVVLANCIGLSEFERKQIQAEWKLQEDGAKRVLALAVRRNVDSPQHKSETELEYLGWVAMEDPLRANVIESIASCQKAGVVIRMVTGDSLPTAVAIARQCRILSSTQHTYMTGAEFIERVCVKDYSAERVKRRCFDFETNQDAIQLGQPFLMDGLKKAIDQEAFDEVWPNLRVLARCEPEDKLVLVSGLKSSELYMSNPKFLPQVVAVTGDGTNDAPALKASDVGFAMNHGTDVAKQASDIILLDGSFNSIVRALIWGRNVHDSVCKFLQFQMTVNISALVLTVCGTLITGKTPMTATQMLWVNLIMDSIGSLGLAMLLPNEDNLLARPPIPRDAKVISVRMMINIFGQAIFQLGYLLFSLLIAKQSGTEENDEAVYYTMFFNTFVLLQLMNELNCTSVNGNAMERVKTTPKFRMIWLVTLGIQVCIVQFGGKVFSCQPLTFAQWLECVNVAFWCIPWQFVAVDPFAHWVDKNTKGAVEQQQQFENELLVGSPTLSYGTNASVDENGDGGSPRAMGGSNRRQNSESKRRWSLLRNTMHFVDAASQPISPHSREHVITKVLRSASVASESDVNESRIDRASSLDGGRRNSLHDSRDDIF